MALRKILESDLSGKGVMGQADVPGLSTLEMQAKVEEVVREVVIPALNENAEESEKIFATKEELEKVVLDSGSVGSVFGRAGNVTAQKGDYTPEMVGAAPEKHAATHAKDGSDPIDLSAAGIAAESHSHGNITAEGKIGTAAGLVVMTGTGGKLEAKNKAASGLLAAPEEIQLSGNVSITVENNKKYRFTGVTSLSMTGSTAEARGFLTFGSSAPSVAVTGFTGTAGDDIASAAANETWEFSCCEGYIIWKKWSE